jgi:hypothetical protein
MQQGRLEWAGHSFHDHTSLSIQSPISDRLYYGNRPAVDDIFSQNIAKMSSEFSGDFPEFHWLSAIYRMVLKGYLNTFPESLTDLQDENHAVIIM